MADQNTNWTYCRLCLINVEGLMNNVQIFDKLDLLSIFPFEIYQNDGHSQVICSLCDRRLIDIAVFFASIQKNQEDLKLVRHEPEIEKETTDDVADTAVEPILNEPEEILIQKDVVEEAETLSNESESAAPEETLKTDSVQIVVKEKALSNESTQPDRKDLNRKTLICYYCDGHFKSKFKIAEHLFEHIPDAQRDIPCHQCDEKFFTSKQMWKHSTKHHPPGETVKVSKVIVQYLACKLCKTKFDDFKRLTKHMEDIHKTKGFVSCCDKKFYTQPSLANHVNKHVNPTAYHCTVCDKFLANRRSYKEHISRHHSDTKNGFQCDKCDKAFVLAFDLKRHTAAVHERDSSFWCEKCNKKFISKPSLLMHNRRFHMNDGVKQICQHCGKSFRCQSDLADHIKSVHIETRKKCDICGIEVKDLKRHMKQHSKANLNFRCEICGHKAKSATYLNLHLNCVHLENLSFKDPQCFQSVIHESSFDDYMSVQNEVTFEVSEAIQPLPKVDSLIRLQKTHT